MAYSVEQFVQVDSALQRFMDLAKQRGLENNSSIDTLYGFCDEAKHVLFLLKQDDIVIGTFGAHSLDLFPNAYRICVRACVLTDQTVHNSLRTVNQIRNHSNLLAKYGLSSCIEWVNDPTANLYITTHPSHVGAMRLMHHIVLPAFESTGMVTAVGEFDYRYTRQTFWNVDPVKYYEQVK